MSIFLTFTVTNSCGCTALDMPKWKEMTLQIVQWVKQPSQVDCLLEDEKYRGAWDTTCRHIAKDITPSIAWRREVCKEEVLDNLPWRMSKGCCQSDKHCNCFKGNVGETSETGWSTHGLFDNHFFVQSVFVRDISQSTGWSITFGQTGDLVLTSIFIKKHVTKLASVQYNNQYTMNDFLLNWWDKKWIVDKLIIWWLVFSCLSMLYIQELIIIFDVN